MHEILVLFQVLSILPTKYVSENFQENTESELFYLISFSRLLRELLDELVKMNKNGFGAIHLSKASDLAVC